jgi:hypothetical protein
MENKTARILNTLGLIIGIGYSIIGVLIFVFSLSYDSYYYDDSDPITGFIVGALLVIIGLVLCYSLKAIAELLENSAIQTKSQLEIVDILRNNQGNNRGNNQINDRGYSNNNTSDYGNVNNNNNYANRPNYSNSPNLSKNEINSYDSNNNYENNNYDNNDLPKL